MFFSTITLGCKVNIYETESLIANLEDSGWIFKREPNNCDVIIINTCTVTQTSDQKSRQMIRQARRNNPNAIIVAMGCFVQTHVDRAIELADIVIGTKDRLKVYELVNEYIKYYKPINHVFGIEKFNTYDEMKLNRLSQHSRGFVKIQDGCENFCSYCLIPYARGVIKSRDPNSVIDEINHLVQLGTKEIIISGINTGTYGKDLNNMSLAKLIDMIMEKTSLYRLRLSSIELMEITDELLTTINNHKSRVAMHLHIPLQGGCDSVLSRMKRKYDTASYEKTIEKIRTIFPDIAITTDCLAGFVGETEEEFNSLLEFIKEIKFSSMHIFPYSRRKGTLADQMEGHLDPSIIKERAKVLIKTSLDLKNEYESSFLGSVMDVLIEQKKGKYWVGHSSNYLEVHIESESKNLENKIINVKISKIDNGVVFGIMEEEYE